MGARGEHIYVFFIRLLCLTEPSSELSCTSQVLDGAKSLVTVFLSSCSFCFLRGEIFSAEHTTLCWFVDFNPLSTQGRYSNSWNNALSLHFCAVLGVVINGPAANESRYTLPDCPVYFSSVYALSVAGNSADAPRRCLMPSVLCTPYASLTGKRGAKEAHRNLMRAHSGLLTELKRMMAAMDKNYSWTDV